MMSWGTKIAIFYSFFVVVLVSLVVSSIGTGDHLVAENYYEKELAYEDHIEAVRNTDALENSLTITYERGENAILMQYPQELSAIRGKVLLYRPSDSGLDQELAIQLDPAHRQVINVVGLLPGLWRVQVDWTAGDKAYYTETKLIVQNQE